MSANSLDVPVLIHETAGIDRSGEPILGGIPLARGILRQGGTFALHRSEGDSDNGPAIVEGTPAAYWNDGSIKWLHVCGNVDIRGGGTNHFRLTTADHQPDEPALSVERVEGTPSDVPPTVRVRGGQIDVDVCTDWRQALNVRQPGRKCMITPGLSGELVLVNPRTGDQRRSLPLRFKGEPEVVSQSAARVVIRLAGHFLREDGSDAGELVTFIEILRDTPQLRLQPVFIYLGRPEHDAVAALTLSVHCPIGADETGRYGFGLADDHAYWDDVLPIQGGPHWWQARLVQHGSSFFRLEKRIGPEGSWVKATEGTQAEGWCCLTGSRGSLAAGLRNMWQEYPRTLDIDARAGRITFGLVPAETSPLDLRRYSPTIHGMVTYESSVGPFPQETHGAYGIAKASELVLHFGDADAADAAADGARRFVKPCRLMPDPSHVASTNVVGAIAPPTESDTGASVERRIESVADFLLQEQQRCGWYGLLDYGDVMESYNTQQQRWAYDHGGYAWINSEALPDFGLWLSTLRHGRADWLEGAIAMSRHNRDVDCYHRGMLTGVGTRHHINHWGDQDKEWRISMPFSRRLHYYMTADPWTLETMRTTIDVFQSYERTARFAPSMTAALAGLYAKWELTGSDEDGEAVWQLLQGFAEAVQPDGSLTSQVHADLRTGKSNPVGEDTFYYEIFFLYSFGGQHLLAELAELLDDKPMSEAIVRHTRQVVSQADSSGVWSADDRRFTLFAILPFLAHAYRATGDRELQQAAHRALKQTELNLDDFTPFGRFETPTISVSVSHEGVNKIMCELASYLHLAPYGLTTLDEHSGQPTGDT